MLGVSALTAPIVGGLIVDATGSYIAALQLGSLTFLLAMILIVIGLAREERMYTTTAYARRERPKRVLAESQNCIHAHNPQNGNGHFKP